MKIPPPNDDHVPTLTIGGAAVVRDRRFLVFAGVILVALSLGFKSELVDPGHAWWLAAGLVAIAAAVILAYLRVDPGPRLPAIEHYVPAVLGAGPVRVNPAPDESPGSVMTPPGKDAHRRARFRRQPPRQADPEAP